MILVPLLALNFGRKNSPGKSSSSDNHVETLKASNEKFFRVLDESNNEISEISDRDFVYGVVASEMPAKFEAEALKAQAVASYTYFCRARNLSRNKNNKEEKYDFTINSQKALGYVSKDGMKEKWKSHFDEYYEKIKNAVDDVYGEVIENEGDLILAAYHAISSGKTEKSADVFGGDVTYLTNVESPGDKFASGYETTVKIEKEKFKEILSSKIPDLEFKGSPENWIGNSTRSAGGMVKEIEICSNNIKGTEIRKMFALRSSDFEIRFDDNEDKFVFTVWGYGHGVGMSQCGAQYMALEGKNYKEILSWYYPGTSVVPISNL